jgi:lipopolysaccharide/colanic/teichoic acid biosynthesis glycosyltransferase
MTAGLYRTYGKPVFDRAASAVGLVLLAPCLLAVAAAIRMTIGSPVLFRHRRPGLHSRPFTLVKFRTMTDARDEDGRLLPDAARTTRLGRLLRTLSLDELPELYNVLCGDMSLIGPRPLLMQHLERYDAHQARRHDVLPGITGWAQVHGRKALSWQRKCELDVWYVDHMSVWLDLRILALTLPAVVTRRGSPP